MMSLRYHVVSIAAVLLALALGVVLGASALSGRVLGALTTDRDELAGQVVALRGDRAAVDTRLQATERLVAAGAPSTVAGVLPGRGVAVVAAPDADPADVAAVSDLVTRAGGRVTGRLALTDAAARPRPGRRAARARPAPAARRRAAAHHHRHRRADRLAARLAARRPPRWHSDEQTTGPEARTALHGAEPTPGTCSVARRARPGAGRARARRRRRRAPTPPATAPLARLARRAGPRRRRCGARRAHRLGRRRPPSRTDPALRSGLSTVDGLEGPASQVAAVLALREQADGRTGLYGPVAGTFTPQTAPAP